MSSKKFKAPVITLIILTGINLLNYIDRNIFSALLPAIKADLHFSDTELGILGSGFIIAYILIAPLFGWLGDRFERTNIMSSGVAVWSIATAFSGMTRSFVGQLTTRIVVGVGESSYTVLSPGFLSDLFPKTARGRILAVYSGAISIGSALGFLIGGALEPQFGWQKSFFIVGIPGIIFAFLILNVQNPVRGSQDSDSEIKKPREAHKNFFATSKELFSTGGFVCAVLGYAAYTFVLGGLAFWMPSFIIRYYGVSLMKANLVFGSITVIGGFCGTLAGGFLSDRWEKKGGNGYFKLSGTAMIVAIPIFWMCIHAQDFNSFCKILFFLEFALFICLSPIDTALLSYVRPEIRGMAIAWEVFVIHFLGDGISRTLMGSVSDSTGLMSAMLICPWVLGLAVIIWFYGIIFYWHPALWRPNQFRLPLLQSHRGFTESGKFKENTMAAFENSRKENFKMTELDVRLSEDGEVVVIHDKNLKRLIQVHRKVLKTSAAELKALVGAPSLKEVLVSDAVTNFINIEVKAYDFKYHKLVREVLRIVDELKCEDRVMISSFNPFVMRMVKRLNPGVLRGYLVMHMGWKFFLPGHIFYSWLANPHTLNIEQAHLNRRRCTHFNKRGIPVVAWTVNDPIRAKQLLDYGVISIISDKLSPENFQLS